MMLRLWSRRSNEPPSLDIQLVTKAVASEWETLRENAIELMRARACYESCVEHLRDLPYELWQGRNVM
jgi:hypothetical protein